MAEMVTQVEKQNLEMPVIATYNNIDFIIKNGRKRKMRIAVCDDEERDLLALKEAVCSFDMSGSIEVCPFLNAAALYAEHEKENFDIAVLDIEMAPPDGYEIAQRLVEAGSAPIIIFLTHSMAYTLKGYGIAFRYLTKPIDQTQLHKALLAAVKEASSKHFTFTLDGSSHVIRTDDIFYFEVFNHHSILHTMDQSYTFRTSLKEIMPRLPAGYFGVPHQSYIINFNHVNTVAAQELHMTNGAVIPISRRKQKDFNLQLQMYLGR